MSALPPEADMLIEPTTRFRRTAGKKGSRHWAGKHYLLAAVAYSGNQRCMPRSP
jgi:hypothetical protein